MLTQAKLFGALRTPVTRIRFQDRPQPGQTRRGASVSALPPDFRRGANHNRRADA